MPGRFPVGKPKLPSWALPVLAVMLTIMVHALWLVIPQPKPPVELSHQAIRLFAYPNLDTQAWSPTLFSLPSPLGFSGAIRQSASNVIPPLKSPVVLNRSFRLKMEDVFPDPGLNSAPGISSSLPVMVYKSDNLPATTDPRYEWAFNIIEGSSADFELTRLPGVPPNGRAMVVTGTITFDANGQVNSLILDSPSVLGGMRSPILRSLRRLRRLGSQEPTRVRFRFEYIPVGVSS